MQYAFGSRTLRSLEAFCAKEAMSAVLHVPDQGGFAVRASWHVIVSQYVRAETPLASQVDQIFAGCLYMPQMFVLGYFTSFSGKFWGQGFPTYS